jgi:acyl carrier protein
MEKTEILEKVQTIFRDVLENDEITLSMDMSAEDIDEYDSLAHIQLVVAIEKQFGVKFNSKEIISWQNIGQMVDSIEAKL